MRELHGLAVQFVTSFCPGASEYSGKGIDVLRTINLLSTALLCRHYDFPRVSKLNQSHV